MEKALEIVLALVITGATLAFGGVQRVAYSAVEACLFIAVLMLLLKQTREGRFSLRLPLWPLVFAFLALVQIIPLPSWLVGSLSPARLLDPSAAARNGKELWTTISIYPNDTALALVKFLAYLCAFVLAAYLFDSRKRKSLIIRTLVFLGTFEAGYGVFQYLTGSHKIFTFTKVYDVSQATGTYINRNHFAGLLELTFPFVIASLFYSYQTWSELRETRGSNRSARESSSSGFEPAFYFFLLVILFLGVVFSHSRVGILGSVLTIVFLGLLLQVRTGQKIWTLGVVGLLACVFGYAVWIGLDPVLARFDQIQAPGYTRTERRLSLWKDEVRLVKDWPLVGTGLGTFRESFLRYQTALVESYVDHAHNDYLEFACDTGVLGSALLFAPILYLFFRMVLSFFNDPRRYRRSVTLGCIGSTAALLFHSLADFNLQIPANALIFAVVLGIGYKVACLERREESPSGFPGRVALSSSPPQGSSLQPSRALPKVVARRQAGAPGRHSQ